MIYRSYVKRVLDVVGSLLLFVLLSPLMLLAALAIKLDSPGPVLFKRTMAGKDGAPFTILKFRTMFANAHEMLLRNPELRKAYETNLKIDNDARVTGVGRILRKTTVDEFPQLINVLKGDMSLIGPRALGDIELERFGEHRDKVLSVRPGMAGLWVANGRHNTSFEHRVELETRYVDQLSFALDVKVFLLSALNVLKMAGAK